jgi:hypothetical protein
MAYFYRGILYWMDGEIDNARACFRSAQFMDSDAENQSYANDYVLLEYLDGFATAKLGGDGSDALARSRKVARLESPRTSSRVPISSASWNMAEAQGNTPRASTASSSGFWRAVRG